MSVFDYNDPIITRFRKGDINDPYVEKTEYFVIENGKVVLTELPSKFHRVVVTGEGITWIEKDDKIENSNEFIVDYTNKIVSFDIIHNGKQLEFFYFGRGLQYLPTSMIYTKTSNGEVTETLQDIITTGESAIENIQILDQKIQEVDNLITETQYTEVWSSITTYSKNNIVSLNGSSFISLQDNNLNNTPDPNGDTLYWGILARRGVDGTGAVNSVNGKVGDVVLNASDVGAEETIFKQSTEPTTPELNDLWIDTSTLPHTFKIYNGTTWDEIGTKLEINDTTTSTTSVWSSQKTSDEISVLSTRLSDYISVSAFGNTKDSVTIQLALDYAESIGGVDVVVPSGIYEITSILQIPSNTKLIGLGAVTFKRMADISAIIINKSDGITGGYDTNKNIVVENITFDGNNTMYTSNVTLVGFGHCTNIFIINCTFRNNTAWHFIELNGCRDSKIENCLLENSFTMSEFLQLDYMGSSTQFPWFAPYDNTSCKNITVERCVFRNLTSSRSNTAIGNHSFLSGVITNNFIIKNNVFENFYFAINHNDVDGLYIKDNYFLNCIMGILFKENQNDSKNWVIESNKYENIKDFNDGGTYAEGRFFFGLTYPLTKVFKNISIKNNIVNTCLTHGIGFTATKNIHVIENVIENCGRNGLYFFGGSDVVISNNNFLNNNTKGESSRADMIVGNSPDVSANVIVSDNQLGTYVTGTNVNKIFVTNNIIKTSATNNGGAEGIHKNNLIAGVWTP